MNNPTQPSQQPPMTPPLMPPLMPQAPYQPPLPPRPMYQPMKSAATPKRTPAQRREEWRLILLITGITLAGMAVLFQCGLDIAIAGRLAN